MRPRNIPAALAPIPYSGTLSVVSAGESRPANMMSSHPTAAISSGTAKPISAQALRAPTAMVILFTLSPDFPF
jgi:hypothetical protein